MAAPERVGLMGGTFNPIHLGHLRSCVEIAETLGLERFYLIPCLSPPHKPKVELAPAHHRLAMTRLAARGNPLFVVSNYEIKRGRVSYSVETVRHFRRKLQGADLHFILGQDAFNEIATWREVEALFGLTNFVVMTRPGAKRPSLNEVLPPSIAARFKPSRGTSYRHESGRRVFFEEVTLLDISSTKIRRLIRQGRSIQHLTPAAVIRYIEAHGLYRGD